MINNKFNKKVKSETALKRLQTELINYDEFKPYFFISINYITNPSIHEVDIYHRKIKSLILCKSLNINSPKKLDLIEHKPKFIFTYELNTLNQYHSHILLERINNHSSNSFNRFLKKTLKYSFIQKGKNGINTVLYDENRHKNYILKQTSINHLSLDLFNSDIKNI